MTIITHSLSVSNSHSQHDVLSLYQCDAFFSDPALCHQQVHDFCDDASTSYNISACNHARYCCLVEIDGHVLHFDDEHILQYSASGSESMEYAELSTVDTDHKFHSYPFHSPSDILVVRDVDDLDAPNPDDVPCDPDSKQLELRYLSMSELYIFSSSFVYTYLSTMYYAL